MFTLTPVHEYSIPLHLFRYSWFLSLVIFGFQHTSPMHALLNLHLSISFFF